jgi:FKBP-type peptidyl-prolyl cis-trans isomerase (trigger factor)
MAKSLLARLEKNQFRLTIIIPKDSVGQTYHKVLAEVGKEKEIPGFRKGMAPQEKVEEILGKDRLYQLTRQRLVADTYAAAIKDYELKPVMRPKIDFVSTKEGEDWQILATACEAPDVKLGAYKEKIRDLLPKAQGGRSEKDKSKVKGRKTNNKGAQSPTHTDKGKTLVPPMGMSWEDKEQKVLDWIVKNIQVELPEVLIEDETNMILSRMFNQMRQLGLTAEQYLDSMRLTPEQVRVMYRKRAEENLILEFALATLTKDLRITVKPEEVDNVINETTDEEVKKALKGDPQRRRSLEFSIKRGKTIGELIRLAEMTTEGEKIK